MGIIKYKEVRYYNCEPTASDHKISISNWRSLQVYKHNVIKVVNDECDDINIYDITLDEFHEINYCNKTVYKPYSILGCRLVCNKCYGTGKTDWVKKIMTSQPKFLNPKFDRNPKEDILMLEIPFHNEYLYTSLPKLESTQEFCPKCHGSGLNHVRNYKVITSFFIGDRQ